MKNSLQALVIGIAACGTFSAHADINIDKEVKSVENKVIEWRRDIHHHPELSNGETRTAAKVSKLTAQLHGMALILLPQPHKSLQELII